jgi:SAM-dependent methyltransferase
MDFHDATFALATFSYNGIDSVDLEGRRAIMREVHRVLRPDGYFVFSTLNRHGREWMPHWPNWDVYHGTGIHPLPLLRATAKLLLSGANRLRWSHRRRDYGEAAIGSLAAHDFSLVTMFTTPLATQRQLQEAGLSVAAMFDPDGHVLRPEDWCDTTSPWYHVVAHKHDADREGLHETAPAASVH